MGYKSRGSSAKRAQILEALIREGPMTADAFISSRHLYHNTWAPIFTALREEELIERTGDRGITSHGAEAWILEITDEGKLSWYSSWCRESSHPV